MKKLVKIVLILMTLLIAPLPVQAKTKYIKRDINYVVSNNKNEIQIRIRFSRTLGSKKGYIDLVGMSTYNEMHKIPSRIRPVMEIKASNIGNIHNYKVNGIYCSNHTGYLVVKIRNANKVIKYINNNNSIAFKLRYQICPIVRYGGPSEDYDWPLKKHTTDITLNIKLKPKRLTNISAKKFYYKNGKYYIRKGISKNLIITPATCSEKVKVKWSNKSRLSVKVNKNTIKITGKKTGTSRVTVYYGPNFSKSKSFSIKVYNTKVE